MIMNSEDGNAADQPCYAGRVARSLKESEGNAGNHSNSTH
jgi:hypothetical protein